LHALGARLIAVDAGIDSLIRLVEGFDGRSGLYVASTTQSSNPIQAEAARTIAYELVEDLGQAPDVLVVPVGGGGTLAAIHRGFRELYDDGAIAGLPRLVGVVPSRYDNLCVALDRGIDNLDALLALPAPRGGPTVLNKIAHDHAPDGVEALRALRESNGLILAFDDGEALDAVREIGRVDGLYFEPSTAILLPALRALQTRQEIQPGALVVALACGSGFRETSVLLETRPIRIEHATTAELGRLLDEG
jgi:threonine synthase